MENNVNTVYKIFNEFKRTFICCPRYLLNNSILDEPFNDNYINKMT